MVRFALGLLNDDSGATAVEYGLLAALIAVAIMAGVAHVGAAISDTFVAIDGAL